MEGYRQNLREPLGRRNNIIPTKDIFGNIRISNKNTTEDYISMCQG
jgi:hypothetical protein